MRLPCLFLIGSLLVGAGCHTPPPVSPETLAKARARQDVDRLNARVVHAYQKRQDALARVRDFQAKLRHSGLSPKERANYQIDLDEATRQATSLAEEVAELEEELRLDWAAYRTQYHTGSRLAGPSAR